MTHEKCDVNEKVFDNITATCLPRSEQHFFAGSNDGKVSEFNMDKSVWVYTFNGSNNQSKITNLECTRDSQYLFSIDEFGFLLQFCINTRTLIYDYGEISRSSIKSLAISRNGAFLYTSDCNGIFKEYSIVHQCLVKESCYDDTPYSPNPNANDEFSSEGFNNLVTGKGCLVASDDKGYIKTIPIVDTKYYADLGSVLAPNVRKASTFNDSSLNESVMIDLNTRCFMMCTKEKDPDNSRVFAFAGEYYVQYCLMTQKFLTKPKLLLDNKIQAFAYNDYFAFTCCSQGEIRQYDTKNMDLVTKYRLPEIGKTKIMVCTPNNLF